MIVIIVKPNQNIIVNYLIVWFGNLLYLIDAFHIYDYFSSCAPMSYKISGVLYVHIGN